MEMESISTNISFPQIQVIPETLFPIDGEDLENRSEKT